MPTVAKPYSVLMAEGKSHRTKAELEQRRKAEEALLTGEKMHEWAETKGNPAAHKHFKRVKGILAKIGKDDAINEVVVNRYCRMLSELEGVESDFDSLVSQQEELARKVDSGEIDRRNYNIENRELMYAKIQLEKSINTRRKMLLDIEKENCMTIASALRSIPKKVEKEDTDDPMSSMLERRMRVV